MQEEDRRAEQVSADAVAEVLGGVPKRRDTRGAPASTHDYDIVMPDATVVAVEVTAVTPPAYRALVSELEKHFRIPLASLSNRWLVRVDGQLRRGKRASIYARELRACLERVLARFEEGRPPLDELEDLERRWPNPWHQVPDHQREHDQHADIPAGQNPWVERASEAFGCSEDAVEVLMELDDAGVVYVSPLDGEVSPGEPNVRVSSPSRSAHVGPDDLSEAVEREAAKDDNRHKLASAWADERHLVVSFCPMSLEGWILRHAGNSLADRGYPRPPQLPKEVDAVWAVLPCDPPIVWRYDRGDSAWQLPRSAAGPRGAWP